MKYFFYLLMLLGFSLHFSNPVYAQKKGKYELGKSDNNPVVPNLNPTVKKEIYRIDFLLPLFLDNLPNKQEVLKEIPLKSMTGVNFYEGILLAIDSLEKKGGMYFDFYVHDIGSKSAKELIRNGDLDSTDVIVGALYAADIPEMAQFAKEKKINLLSVLSPSAADVTNNANFIMTQATLETHLRNMATYSEFNKSYLNTVLLSGDKDNEATPLQFYKNEIRRKHQHFKYNKDSLQLDHLKYFLTKNSKNLIYTTAIDIESASKILEQLSSIADEYPMEIIGLPTWKGLPILTNGKLNPNISVYLTYPFRYDEEVEKRLYLRDKYDVFKRGLPNELVYRGFETTLWLAQLLQEYGTVFNNDINASQAFSTLYKIQFKSENKQLFYYENMNLYIYKYNDGKLNIIE